MSWVALACNPHYCIACLYVYDAQAKAAGQTRVPRQLASSAKSVTGHVLQEVASAGRGELCTLTCTIASLGVVAAPPPMARAAFTCWWKEDSSGCASTWYKPHRTAHR